MASATGIPEHPPSEEQGQAIGGGRPQDETEPLLGRPGDVAQSSEGSYLKNLIVGTAGIAQFGAILLFILIWVTIFTKPLSLFSGHPLAQSLAILTLIQSILFLQPTHTAEQKRIGQRVHASLNLLAFLFLVTGVVIIEYNKVRSGHGHFSSVHGYLGVITSIVIGAQYLVGFTMWATPVLYGGVDNAKVLYKYHRWSGYLILILLLATVAAATETSYNLSVLKLKLWAMILLSVLVLVGVFPRIHKYKLGLS